MSEALTAAGLERMFEAAKNWGRWGDEEQRGALNLISDKKRVEAAGLVLDGAAVSLQPWYEASVRRAAARVACAGRDRRGSSTRPRSR